MNYLVFAFIALGTIADVSAQEFTPINTVLSTPAQQLDVIEVLGSHIRGIDLETRHPMLVLDRADIERTGLTSISDIVQLIVANGETANRNINNGSNGEQLVNLRSLGFNRTLVLLNGERFVSDISGAVDLSGIPLALVERIEVLLDGASAIYGSDAIAGVINIVTRREYDGGAFGAYFGKTSYDDGERRAYDLTWGHKGDGWSAAVGVEYGRDDPVFAKDRAISAVPVFGLPPGAIGSTATPFSWLQPNPSDDFLRLKSGAQGTSLDDFRAVDFDADRYNFAPQTYLQTPQERRAVFAQARYEFSPTLALVADALFNQRRSELQLASSVIRIDANNTGDPNAIAIAADNVYNPFGEPIDRTFRRLVEAGPRLSKINVDSTRAHIGLDGAFSKFDRNFIWSADATVTRANQSDFDGPYLDNRKLLLALGPSFFDASGTARCGKPDAIIDGCVPMNLFGPPGSITAAMLNYAGAFETNRDRNESRIVDAHLSTNRLLDLPDGALGAAAGVEYRRESGASIVDPLDAGGYANGNGGTTDSTHGAYSVSEAYLELEAPLLADKSFAHKLDLGFGTRYSHYSNFGGTLNSQLGLRWQPVDEVLVRANYAQGFRAPAITELFGGATQGHDTGIVDPCDARNKPTPAILARCAALDVPENVNSRTQEANITTTGNTQLQPETSRSRGLGVVYTPMWTSGLDVSLDWYNIRLRNAIGDLGEQAVVDECYALNDNAACTQIKRNPNDGTIFHIAVEPQNIASGIETEGYDLSLRYRHDTPIGQVSARWDTNYVVYFGELGKPVAGSVLSDGSVAFGNVVGLNSGGGFLFGVAWRWRSQAQLVWDRAPWSVSITGRYFSHIDEDCSQVAQVADHLNDPSLLKLCSNPDQPIVFGNYSAPRNRVASVTFTDLEGSWESPWQGRFTLGVRNAFDRSPPVAYSAFTNSFFPDYDLPGRFWYVRYQQRF